MAGERLRAKKQVGGVGAPVTYAFSERVFGAQATPAAKAAAKAAVVASLRSRVLSSDAPVWDASTAVPSESCPRTNVHAERNRAHMFVYNFRAEKLPRKNPTLKPKTNRFNTGILEVALRDEDPGDSLGDDRVARGFAKRMEELPNHPELRDAAPWDASVELTRSVRAQHFARVEAARRRNSERWKQQVATAYRSPEQLASDAEERMRRDKEAAPMATPRPPESLVAYGDPIFTGEAPGAAAIAPSRGSATEDVLHALLPPQVWTEPATGAWMRFASTAPATRLDALRLQEALEARLLARQARERGLCPVREELYAQALDELVRQAALDSPERGLLLLRVRDELRMTTDAYRALHAASLAFGARKQLQAEDGAAERAAAAERLRARKAEREAALAALAARLELLEKRAAERRALQDKRFKDEIDFLKYQGQHLDAFLKAAGGPK